MARREMVLLTNSGSNERETVVRDISPGSVPKPEDTPPSSRFWMELEGGAEPRMGRRKEAEPRQIKGRADKLQVVQWS